MRVTAPKRDNGTSWTYSTFKYDSEMGRMVLEFKGTSLTLNTQRSLLNLRDTLEAVVSTIWEGNHQLYSPACALHVWTEFLALSATISLLGEC